MKDSQKFTESMLHMKKDSYSLAKHALQNIDCIRSKKVHSMYVWNMFIKKGVTNVFS